MLHERQNMIISIINKKGGVGKTSFGFSIAKDLELYLQSNDASIIESIYPNMSKISAQPKLIDNCVYDFGGFVSAGVLDIAAKSDFIIVPCTALYNSILRTSETINELKEVNKNIIVLITDYTSVEDKEQVENALKSSFKNLKYFYFKRSKILENSMRLGGSFKELGEASPLLKVAYRNFLGEYDRLLKTLKNI